MLESATFSLLFELALFLCIFESSFDFSLIDCFALVCSPGEVFDGEGQILSEGQWT